LATTIQLDIQLAVHQCAQFCQGPKMSHKKPVKHIICYLKRTKEQGLIMHINHNKGIKCFVDTDFAGVFGVLRKENLTNSHNCITCTSSMVKYANHLIIWTSMLQRTIGLSTTEAEYMALTAAICEGFFTEPNSHTAHSKSNTSC
jgi:hypothetical protein